MELTVIIPSHNPDRSRLARTLAGLAAQTLGPERWETLLIDNASTPSIDPTSLPQNRPASTRIVREPQLGLSAARRRGFGECRSEFIVLVDDDNVLAPDYLAQVLAIFAAHPTVGLAGGKSLPQFEAEPPAWAREFFPLLATRDLGDREILSAVPPPAAARRNEYPSFAPIGAGMAARRAALEPWLSRSSALSDRRGSDLTSAGDNDIVLCALRAGWNVGYFPQRRLDHLIPPGRLQPEYLARLNRGIQQSWQQVLARHAVSDWPPLTRTGAWLRKTKAWITYRGWSRPAGRIRWQGACGHFDGRICSRQ